MGIALWLGIIVGLAAVGVLGDFFIKLSGQGPVSVRYFTAGILVYAATAFGWFFVMQHVKLSTLGVYYALTTVLLLTLVSIFYFKESLNGYEVVGIFLALVSLALMGRFA